MQQAPSYDDVVDDVKAFLLKRAEFAVSEGIGESMIDLDPGIGFGKTAAHNYTLLSRLDELAGLGFRLMVGVSRKSFLGAPTSVAEPRHRMPGTIAANVMAYERGARVFRVHDVAEHVQALAVARAVQTAE
jgi:dihydropteroate synthase